MANNLSRTEELLSAINDGSGSPEPPMSRVEKILYKLLGEDVGTVIPQSRIEKLLVELYNKEISGDIIPKEFTQNGVYNASADGKDGYNPITVNIPDPILISKIIKENGIYTASADNADGYSEITVDVRSNRKVFGFHLDSTESDPTACITYLEDAIGATPAYMDFTNSIWNWGSWGNAFFIPKPCMVKYDGSVDYYLNPNDYTKKIDGTASDIADTSYPGNAMMEWPKIYTKFVPDENDPTSVSIFFSNYKVDNDYHFWQYIDADGNEINHFYTAIYNGSNVNGTLRSISGLAAEQSKTTSQQIAEANENNQNGKTEWNIGLFSDRILINYLTVLITKSLDCKAKVGQGINTGSQTAVNNYRTGALNTKGLFYGSTSTSVACKVFGIENFYAFQWHRTLGLIDINGHQMVKLCYGRSDGSSTDSYNQNGSNYIDSGSSSIFETTTGGWLKYMTYKSLGYAYASTDSASGSTYYKSYVYENPTTTTLALFGGGSNYGSYVSLFSCDLHGGAGDAYWSIGASLSLKPLAG